MTVIIHTVTSHSSNTDGNFICGGHHGTGVILELESMVRKPPTTSAYRLLPLPITYCFQKHMPNNCILEEDLSFASNSKQKLNKRKIFAPFSSQPLLFTAL